MIKKKITFYKKKKIKMSETQLQNIENPEKTEKNNNNESNENESISYLNLSNTSKSKEKEKEFKYNFKIILLGDSNVGKTSIFNRFINDNFNESYNSTIQSEYKYKSIYPDLKTEVILHIWDTAGSEKYKSITQQYYRDAHGIILIFDVCNRDSFNNLKDWINDIKNNTFNECQVIIVGNKNDINERKVSFDEGNNFSQKYGFSYIDASAKSGNNILLIFDTISKKSIKVFKDDVSKNYTLNSNLDKENSSFNLDLIKKKKEIMNISNEKDGKKNNCC